LRNFNLSLIDNSKTSAGPGQLRTVRIDQLKVWNSRWMRLSVQVLGVIFMWLNSSPASLPQSQCDVSPASTSPTILGHHIL